MIKAKFKINVGKKVKDYYSVIVFSTKKEMEKFFDVGKFEAITNSFTLATMKDGKVSRLPLCGVIAFYEDNVTPWAVSHEMTHALNHYWKNKEIKFNLGEVSKDWFEKDEMYATILGYMVEEFYKNYKV